MFRATLLACLFGLVVGCGFPKIEPPQKEEPKSEVKRPPTPEPVEPKVATEEVKGKKATKPAEVRWSPPDKALKIGGTKVQIDKVIIGKVPLKGAFGDSSSEEELLIVKISISNSNPTKKVEYKSWSGNGSIFRTASLKDNFDNDYKGVTFGFTSPPEGSLSSESIYPGKSVTDVLVFERPIDTAKHLDLELPAKNLAGEGTFRFRIPINFITRE